MNRMTQSHLIAAVAFQSDSNTRMGPAWSKANSTFSGAKRRLVRIGNSLKTQDRGRSGDGSEHLLCAGCFAGLAQGGARKEAVLAPSGGLRFGEIEQLGPGHTS